MYPYCNSMAESKVSIHNLCLVHHQTGCIPLQHGIIEWLSFWNINIIIHVLGPEPLTTIIYTYNVCSKYELERLKHIIFTVFITFAWVFNFWQTIDSENDL